jgi:serine/threonine protein phosphatase 1
VLIREDEYDRIIAIGDLHGHLAPLRRILERIAPGPSDFIVFIGDYIDRGPDSREVVQDLIELNEAHPNTAFLKGNHEDMLLGSLGYGALVTDLNTWLYNGGSSTLRSYGLGRQELDRILTLWDEEERVAALRKAFPPSHLDFFLELAMYVESEGYFFCHGGVEPYRSIEQGKNSHFQLLWMREHLYANKPVWDKTVVCGHTPLREVLLTPRLICIDTGLHYNGKLTALNVKSGEIVQVGQQEVRE